MAALSAWHPLVAPRAPGVPSPAIGAAVLQGAIEFCERTLTLQRTLPAVATVADQAAYTLIQSGEVVAKLLSAKLDGEPLRLAVPSDSDDEAEPVLAVHAPSQLVLSGTMQATLQPAPSVAGLSLVVRAAMRPSRSATSLADELFERHASAIADWAAHLLLATPKATYHDARGAETAAARFMDAVAAERARMLRNRSRSRTRARVLWC